VRIDAGGEDCGPLVEVLVVRDVEAGLAKQAGCEVCAEDAVAPQCGEHCGVVLVQCRSPEGARTAAAPPIPIAVDQYDPATGTYLAPDGHQYTQAETCTRPGRLTPTPGRR
jgi:hypothetical protein